MLRKNLLQPTLNITIPGNNSNIDDETTETLGTCQNSTSIDNDTTPGNILHIRKLTTTSVYTQTLITLPQQVLQTFA